MSTYGISISFCRRGAASLPVLVLIPRVPFCIWYQSNKRCLLIWIVVLSGSRVKNKLVNTLASYNKPK